MKQEKIEKIGKRKYAALKEFNFETIDEEGLEMFNKLFKITVADAIKQIQSYEKEHNSVPNPDYGKPKEQTKREVTELTKEILWKMFTEQYLKNEGHKYDYTNTIENLKPLIYYFIGDLDNFKQCKSVSLTSQPSLSKGLLIIGGYGNGKTSIMKALEGCLRASNVNFKGYTANDCITMYEGCDTAVKKDGFYKTMCTGVRYYDDILTERIANNYGKANIFKDIFEKRYNKNLKTHISINYKDGTGEDLSLGLEQIGEKYGSRVYDRLFSMYNVIEFKGGSFRK